MFRKISAAACCAALLLLAGACSKEASSGLGNLPVRFAIRTDGLSAGEEFGPVTAYLFDGGQVLSRTLTLVPSGGAVELTVGSDTKAYFLTDFTLDAAPGISLGDFLELNVGEQLAHDNSAPEFLAAEASFAAGAPDTVTFRRRTARIDLDTRADASIAVTALTLKGVPAAAAPFAERAAVSDRRLTYEKHFDRPLSGLATDLFRLYASDSPVEAVIDASYGGVPVQITASIPSVLCNRSYTLTLRNAGASLEGTFVVAPWEEGDTVVGAPDTEHRIRLDRDASVIPAGVQVDFEAGTVEIPAAGAELTLAFRASMPVEIAATEGMTSAVRIGDPQIAAAAEGGYVSRYAVSVAPQGRGRLGYEVLLHLKYALFKDHYDFVALRVAASDNQIETVALAGCEWMAFHARSRELEDQIYPLDGSSVEQMYRSDWTGCTGGLFQFGRMFMYVPWQGYSPSNDLGSQQQDIPWQHDTHMPCPEGYRVPTPDELEALLPAGTTIPGRYRTAAGERITATLHTADAPIVTPTGVTGTPRYMKLTADDGRFLILPLAGSKGDKSTTNNPGFGQRAVLWSNDDTGMPGGWARTHTVTLSGESATFEANRLQMEGFASVRCVKK